MPVIRQLGEDILRLMNWKEDIPWSAFFRKGVVGDWKNWFTVAQNEEFDEVFRTKMAGSKMKFSRVRFADGMSQFEHVKDKFGNDLWFGDGGEMRFPPMSHVQDYRKQLQDIKQLPLREDDVIVACFPKSGTNWVHQLVLMLVQGATEVPTVFSENNSIFLDTSGGRKGLPKPDSPRIFFSHFQFRFLPLDVIDKKVKVVYVTRNPKDLFVSFFCHLKNFDGKMGYPGTWPQFFSLMLNGGGVWYGDYFEHLREWEKAMDDHPDLPIFYCNYEDTIQDPVGQVVKLNEFLGTGRSRELCEAIAEACRFSRMPVIREMGEDILRLINWKEDVPWSAFFRKGVVGDWKNWFTVAQNEEFDEVYRTKMAGSKMKFSRAESSRELNRQQAGRTYHTTVMYHTSQ
nr:hypothetical protein BaRGS_020110 [Batillaria attramentaria]